MCLLVLVGLLLPSFTGLVSASHPPEDQSFTTPHSGVDFPVGWEDFSYFTGSESTATQREYRLLYPAMTSGEGAEMAVMVRFLMYNFSSTQVNHWGHTWISLRA